MSKIKASFKAVFSGDATNEQFLEVFGIIMAIALIVVLPFVI